MPVYEAAFLGEPVPIKTKKSRPKKIKEPEPEAPEVPVVADAKPKRVRKPKPPAPEPVETPDEKPKRKRAKVFCILNFLERTRTRSHSKHQRSR